jgi:hypothetical protein
MRETMKSKCGLKESKSNNTRRTELKSNKKLRKGGMEARGRINAAVIPIRICVLASMTAIVSNKALKTRNK